MKTPSPYKSAHESFDEEGIFSASEFEFLIDTIKEYTDKLRAQIERAEQQTMVFGMFLLGLGSSVGLAATFFPSLGYNSRVETINYQLVLAGIVLSIASVVLLVLQSYLRLRNSRNERDRLAFILQRLVRRGSQISDRGQVTFGNRVMVDIILSDAENLIRRTASQSGSSIIGKFGKVVLGFR